MANSTTTTLNDLLPLITAEALFQAQEQSIMRNLVRNYTIPAGSGKSIVVPTYAPVTAYDIAEGTDLSGDSDADQAISTGGVTISIGEVGIMTNVTDLARVSSASNVIADVGKLFGAAIAAKMDKDLIANFANFSGGIGSVADGGAGTLSAATIFKGIAQLRNAGVPTTGMACVINPMVAYDLKSSMTSTFAGHAGDLSNEAMRTGYVGTIGGVAIYESSHVENNGTAGDFVGGMFHKDALALAMMQDIKIEVERNASLRADELVATAVYGSGELFDTYGVRVNADSSIL
jgi:N4-gp56 family major capsid protein